MKTKEVQKPWIEYGYKVFAFEGPQGLKIERLSREIGKNKSSFYHHFADLEIFTSLLLDYHITQVILIAEKESYCKSINELFDIIIEYKIYLMFNRQLRIHRINDEFEKCFVKTNEITVKSIIGIWAEMLGLKDNSYLAGLVLNLSLENFYLQITDETLNHTWLNNYINQLRELIFAFKKMEVYSVK